MNGTFGIDGAGVGAFDRTAPLGLGELGRILAPGLRYVRFAYVAPPWAGIGLCLRHENA